MATDIEYGNGIIRVQKSKWKGHEYMDIRKFYKDDKGENKPTRKGITFSPESAKEIAEAILKEAGED